MPRPEKVQAVAEIKERMSDADAVFVAEYSGLSVTEQQKLRRGLTAAGGEFKVVKMTLARRAATELGHDGLLEMLVGPTGLAFASGDAAAAAKVLRDFSRDNARLVIKGALFGAEVLPPERVSQLADIEPREVLLGKVAGAFQAPMAIMAGLLAAMPRAMATMVRQLIDRADTAPAEPDAETTEGEPAQAPSAPTMEPDEATEADDAAGSAQEATTDTEDPSDDDAAESAEEE